MAKSYFFFFTYIHLYLMKNYMDSLPMYIFGSWAMFKDFFLQFINRRIWDTVYIWIFWLFMKTVWLICKKLGIIRFLWQNPTNWDYMIWLNVLFEQPNFTKKHECQWISIFLDLQWEISLPNYIFSIVGSNSLWYKHFIVLGNWFGQNSKILVAVYN